MKLHVQHIVPVGGGERVHVISGSCWCFPILLPNQLIVTHNSQDKREQYERAHQHVDPERPWIRVEQEVEL